MWYQESICPLRVKKRIKKAENSTTYIAKDKSTLVPSIENAYQSIQISTQGQNEHSSLAFSRITFEMLIRANPITNGQTIT